jgi:regulatory protein
MTQRRPKPEAKKERKKRPVTRDYLFNAGAYYLLRYASSEANFRRVMMRKVGRREKGETSDEEIALWLDETCEKFRTAGALNDNGYAEGKVLSMRRVGKSASFIRSSLRAKGVDQTLVDSALERHESISPHDDDWTAAVTFARRKRFGPYTKYRLDETGMTSQLRNRQLASFARAGFNFGYAKTIVDAKTVEELDRN